MKELTEFGIELAQAVKFRQTNFDSSIKAWPKSYGLNGKYIQAVRNEVEKKSSALIVGAGPLTPKIDFKALKHEWIVSGVQWLNFQNQIEIDILIAAHVAPLQASFFGSQNNAPKLIIHGVYEKVPPVLKKSITIRWGDPFRLLQENNKCPTSQSAMNQLDEIFETRGNGLSPYIPSVANVTFLNAMVMIWLGSREIIFTGVDPLSPRYFFHGDHQKAIDIIQALSRINPNIAIWDGRNARIGLLNRDTDHRTQEIIGNLSAQSSGIDRRIDLMQKGFELLKRYAVHRGVKLSYIGESKFLGQIGIKRVD